MSDSDFLKRRGLRMARTWLLNSGVAMALGLACAICAAAAEPPAVDPVARRLGRVMSEWRCPIMAYLAAIRGNWEYPDGSNRYLVLAPKKRPALYVQCIFFEHEGAKIDCEVASGFYEEKIWDSLTPERIAFVGALGYSTDRSNGNFLWRSEDNGVEMLYDVAGLLVESLVRVFDLDVGDDIEITAPLLPNRALTGVEGSKRCPIPIS